MSLTLTWGPIAPPDPSPVFSGVTVTVSSATSVTVSWSVSPASQGQVEYDTDSGSPYASASTLETGYLGFHSQLITGLTPGTTYHFRIKGTTAAAVTAYTDESTFGTPAASGFDDGITYSRTDVVPTGTGWTDGSDCIVALQAMIDSIPNGTSATVRQRIRFPAGYTYVISTGINITGKSYWTFEGGGTEVDDGEDVTVGGVTRWKVNDTGHTGGAVIRTTGSPGAAHRSSVFYAKNASGAKTCTDIRWHALTVEGSGVPGSTVASVTAGDGGETQHGWCLMGVDGAWIDHCISDKCKGDGVFATDAADGSGSSPYLSRNIQVTSTRLRRNGRMLVAMVGCQGLTIRRCLFEDAAYAHVDSEPDQVHQTNRDLLVTECTFHDWGWDPGFYGSPLLLTASKVGITFAGYIQFVDNVLVGSSITTGRPSEWNSEVTATPYLAHDKTGPMTITGNVRTAGYHAGPSVYLSRNLGGTTITGNRFGRTSGSLTGGTAGGAVTQSDNT